MLINFKHFSHGMYLFKGNIYKPRSDNNTTLIF